MSKAESLFTPVGTIKFPKTKVNDKEWGFLHNPKGITEDDVCSWKFVLTLDPADPKVKELLATLDEQHSKIKKSNFQPYKLDKAKNDDGEIVETGFVAINFTTAYPLAMFDANKKPCNVDVGWGSRVAVKFNTKPVDNKGKVGLGRYARAIQIVELKESTQDISGFEQREGFAMTASDTDTPWEE